MAVNFFIIPFLTSFFILSPTVVLGNLTSFAISFTVFLDIDEKMFYPYLSMVKRGIYPSAGFGIGIERLTRYICGIDDIKYTHLFPKILGNYCI